MKAVVTVVGHDSMGIIAVVSTACAEAGANIEDITQSVIKDYFAMVMVVDIDKLNIPFNALVDKLDAIGKERSLEIRTMHEDIFNSMHRI